jgi:hypothetical protein
MDMKCSLENRVGWDLEIRVTVLAQSLVYHGNNLIIFGLALEKLDWRISSNIDIPKFSPCISLKN